MLGMDAPDALVRAVQEAIRRVKPRGLAGRLREVFGVDCEEALRACRSLVLYLAASEDALVHSSAFEAIRAVRNDVEVRTVRGPHLLLQLAPHAAWHQIEDFLNRL